jgi:hypothetical protein
MFMQNINKRHQTQEHYYRKQQVSIHTESSSGIRKNLDNTAILQTLYTIL